MRQPKPYLGPKPRKRAENGGLAPHQRGSAEPRLPERLRQLPGYSFAPALLSASLALAALLWVVPGSH